MKYSREEINDLYEKYKEGDTESGNKIIESFIPLANSIASSFSKRFKHVNLQDLQQEAYLILCKRLPKYNTQYCFSTFAHKCISNHLKNIVLAANYRIIRGTYIPPYRVTEKIKNGENFHCIRHSVNNTHKLERKNNALEKILLNITEEEEKLISEYYCDTSHKDDMCKKYNTTWDNIYYRIRHIIGKLKRIKNEQV